MSDSITCIELRESVYMIQLSPLLPFISFRATFIAFISAVCIEASSGRAPLLVASSKTAARPTIFPGFFDIFVDFLFFFVFAFVMSFLLRNRRLCYLLSTVDVVACCCSPLEKNNTNFESIC